MLWNGRMGNTDIKTKLRKLGQTEVPWGVRFGIFLTYVFLYLLWFSGYFGF